MDLTIKLLDPTPTYVRGQEHRRESFPFVQVTPKAPVLLEHFGHPVGHLLKTWRDDGGVIWATALIDPDHETKVRTALNRTKSASVEFLSDELDSDLRRDDWEPSVMVHRGATIAAVAVGIDYPARTDSRVTRVSPPPAPPATTKTDPEALTRLRAKLARRSSQPATTPAERPLLRRNTGRVIGVH